MQHALFPKAGLHSVIQSCADYNLEQGGGVGQLDGDREGKTETKPKGKTRSFFYSYSGLELSEAVIRR